MPSPPRSASPSLRKTSPTQKKTNIPLCCFWMLSTRRWIRQGSQNRKGAFTAPFLLLCSFLSHFLPYSPVYSPTYIFHNSQAEFQAIFLEPLSSECYTAFIQRHCPLCQKYLPSIKVVRFMYGNRKKKNQAYLHAKPVS